MPANFDGSTQQRRALVSYQHSTNHQLLPRASLTVVHSSVIPRFMTRLRSVVKLVDLRWHLSDHGELFCLLYLLADNKTKRHFRDRHEAIDDDSEAYCWRRSGFFWRMRASLGLACAQATTLAAQVFGKGNPQSHARRTSA